MNAQEFLGLEPTEDPTAFRLPLAPHLLSGMGALFGGCGLAAGVEAMERVTGRGLVWATAQYLSYARPPAVLDVKVVEAVRGHQVSQARATGSVDGNEIITVNAALGSRPADFSGSWAIMPDVPGPEECPARMRDPRHQNTVMSRMDMRMANGRQIDDLPGPPGDGRSALWVRFPDFEWSAAGLAVIGDLVPFGISQALGERAGGNSLDNTLRLVDLVPTEWILLDIRIHAIDRGFGHGLVHLWAEDGTLLGTASQSVIARKWREEPR